MRLPGPSLEALGSLGEPLKSYGSGAGLGASGTTESFPPALDLYPRRVWTRKKGS
jgi:hypothetical protein